MDGTALPVSSLELYGRLGTASAPVLIDVRRDEAFSKDGGLIVGAFHRSPGEVERWSKELTSDRPGRHCARPRSQPGVAASLRQRDQAAYSMRHCRLKEACLPTRKKLGAIENKVTRERPKIDRTLAHG
jgi:hypothetical protein